MRTPAGAATTVEAGLVRLSAFLIGGLLMLAAVWLAAAPPESVQAPWLTMSGMATVAAVVAGVMAVTTPTGRWARAVLVSAGLLPFLGLLWVREEFRLSGPWAVLEVAALAAALTGVLPRRWWAQSALLIAVMVLLLESLLGTADEPNVFHNPTGVAVSGVRVGTLSLAAMALAHRLRSSARALDVARQALRARQLRQEAEQARHMADDEMRAAVHDTVLNTLEAAAIGVPPSRVPDLRRRCREDLNRMAGELQADPVIGETLPGAVRRWRSRGLSVNLRVSRTGNVPRDVESAFAGATDEALRNIMKHSGTDTARVDVVAAPDHLTVTITDHGVGFDTDTGESGLGLTQSVRGRVRSVGGAAGITTERGAGTTVTLHWPVTEQTPSTQQSPTQEHLDLLPSLRRGLAVVTTLTATVALVALIVAHPAQASAGWLAIALSTSVLAAAWLLLTAATGPLTGLHAAVAVVVSAAVPWAVALGERYCSPATESALPLDGRILPLLVLLTLAPRIHWWAAGLVVTAASSSTLWQVWSVLDPICGVGQLPVWAVLFVTSTGALLLGRLVRSQQRATDLLTAEELTEQLAEEAHQARRATRAAWQRPALTSALRELESLASGSTDPDDPTRRAEIQSTAAHLRATVMASRLPGELGAFLQMLVGRSAARGRHATIRLSGTEVDPPPAPDMSLLEQAVVGWVGEDPGGLRITLTSGAGGSSLLLSRPTDPDGTAPAQTSAVVRQLGSIRSESWADEDGSHWLAEWSVADAGLSPTPVAVSPVVQA